jgi:hypothetical protein
VELENARAGWLAEIVDRDGLIMSMARFGVFTSNVETLETL